MKLYDYLKMNKNEEVTVIDSVYDCKSYWYYSESKEDKWDMSIMEFAKLVEIDKINSTKDNVIVCKFSTLIEEHMSDIKQSNLFINNSLDSIMYDFDNIIAGYVSENWLIKFVEILKKI